MFNNIFLCSLHLYLRLNCVLFCQKKNFYNPVAFLHRRSSLDFQKRSRNRVFESHYMFELFSVTVTVPLVLPFVTFQFKQFILPLVTLKSEDTNNVFEFEYYLIWVRLNITIFLIFKLIWNKNFQDKFFQFVNFLHSKLCQKIYYLTLSQAAVTSFNR